LTLEKLVWFENIDGIGGFGPLTNIVTTTWTFVSLETVDLDNDSDIDILGATSEVFWIRNEGTVDVSEELDASVLPSAYSIQSISPNPFNASTSIVVSLPTPSELKISVYNMLGQVVAVLVDGQRSAGNHALALNSNGLSSGIYFVRAFVPGEMNEVRKIVLMK